ncbi:MAG: peptidoglycan DD-metalloendopeptidase family protein [Elusimicrobiota bacterium]
MKKIFILLLFFLIVPEGWGGYGQPNFKYDDGVEEARNQLKIARKDFQAKKIGQKRMIVRETALRRKIEKIEQKVSKLQTESDDSRVLLELSRKNLTQIKSKLDILQTDSTGQKNFLDNNSIDQLKREQDKELYVYWKESHKIAKLEKYCQKLNVKKIELAGEVEKQKINLEKEISDLEKLIQNLTQKIEQPEKKPTVKKQLEKNIYSSKINKKGRFSWPVKGEVVTSFGKQKLDDLDANYISNGIKIRAAPSEPVIAVDKGKIVYAKKLQGYGKMVIIEHRKELVTIYGQLGEIIGQVGKTIKKGAILGRVSGSKKEAEIYFEIRYKNKPENPLKWLTR